VLRGGSGVVKFREATGRAVPPVVLAETCAVLAYELARDPGTAPVTDCVRGLVRHSAAASCASAGAAGAAALRVRVLRAGAGGAASAAAFFAALLAM
jgi:hypothetical protein